MNEKLGGYIKMAVPKRQEAVRELTAEGRGTREIDEILGVSPDTVAVDVRNLTAADASPLDAVAGLAADEKLRTEAQRREETKSNDKRSSKRSRSRMSKIAIADGAVPTPFEEAEQVDEEAAV